MKSYILKPKSVKKSGILQKEYILSSSRHHTIHTNKNYKLLIDLIKISKNSINISNKKKYFYYVEIGSISNSTGYVSPTNKKSIDISTDSVFSLQKDDILISTVRTYLGGIGIITQSDDNIVASKALIVLRELISKEVDRYYLFGVLRSGFFIEQTSLILNASMYPRMDKDSFDQLKIPFPTKNNHQEPQKIERLVSLITQNIINKEEQIKAKNKKIDELIERELKENQNPKNSFKYSYPKISEIKLEARLDTGIYEREFKEINFLITNYKGGFLSIGSIKNTFVSGSTPEIYLPSTEDDDYWWIAVADIEWGLFYKKIINIRLKESIKNTLKDGDILITRKGATVGKMNLFFQTLYKKAFVNEDIKVLRLDLPMYKKIFLGMFLKNFYGQKQLLNHGSKGTKQGLTNPNILDVIAPNFSDLKQQEIAKEYYFQIDKNQNLTLENYLQKETARNQQIGIFQLNMEIFTLRKKLEEIIDKIINETPIEINLTY